MGWHRWTEGVDPPCPVCGGPHWLLSEAEMTDPTQTTTPKVGDRIVFESVPGIQIDLTIDELLPGTVGPVISRATVHGVFLAPPVQSLGKLPDGWVREDKR